MKKTPIPKVLILEAYIEEILRETQTKLALTKKEEDKLHHLSTKIEVALAMLDEYMLTIVRRLERPRTYLQGAEALPFEPNTEYPGMLYPRPPPSVPLAVNPDWVRYQGEMSTTKEQTIQGLEKVLNTLTE